MSSLERKHLKNENPEKEKLKYNSEKEQTEKGQIYKRKTEDWQF